MAHVESDNLHEAGEELVGLIGEPDKPEVERNVEDVDASLQGLSDNWLNRQKLLDEALQKATTFQEELMVISRLFIFLRVSISSFSLPLKNRTVIQNE